MQKSLSRMPSDISLYLIAGVATAPYFMVGLQEELEQRLRESGVRGTIRSERLFPYGDWGGSVLRQLRDIRRDLRFGPAGRQRSLGGLRVARTVMRTHLPGSRILLIGHSGGGAAAVHAAQCLLEREPELDLRIVQIGSPKCPVPSPLQPQTSYVYAVDERGRPKDPICRLGSWHRWSKRTLGLPLGGRLAPGHITPTSIIGGHADYFRRSEFYCDDQGRSNAEKTIAAFWEWLGFRQENDDVPQF